MKKIIVILLALTTSTAQAAPIRINAMFIHKIETDLIETQVKVTEKVKANCGSSCLTLNLKTTGALSERMYHKILQVQSQGKQIDISYDPATQEILGLEDAY